MKIFCLLILFAIFSFATSIDRDTLSNGLVVLTVEAHKIPMVEMRIFIHAGSVFDHQGKEGLANLVSRMLLRGTNKYSADEIVESIESVGGVLSAYANEDYAVLNGKVLSKDLPRLMDILSDCLQRPTFDSLELMRLKRELISRIKAKEDDPFGVSEKGFRSLLFGNHPLGHFPEGFDSTVARIDNSDAKEFYKKYYLPNNTFFVFVGDFNKDSLMAMLNKSFTTWERGKLPKTIIDEPVTADQPTAKIIPMDISQAYILLGNLGPKYGTEDWYATRVMNYILGGSGLTSRISGKIREEKGLAYIAYSYFQRFKNGGYYVAEVQTKKDMANEVVQTLLNEIKEMQQTIYIDELNRAKKFYTGYFPLSYDTYNEMANVVAQIEIEDLGLDYLTKFETLIANLKIDELKASAQKYLHPGRFYLLIVGDIKPEDIKVKGLKWIE